MPNQKTDWNTLLREIDGTLFAAVEDPNNLYIEFCHPEELEQQIIASRSSGRPPASEADILKAETRLGIKLPVSYRDFLLSSNGWYHCFHWPSGLSNLCPIEEVERCNVGYWTRSIQSIIDREFGLDASVWKGVEVVNDALLIGASDGNDFIFLNPNAIEWEVATWQREIGVELHSSFEAMMRQVLKFSFV